MEVASKFAGIYIVKRTLFSFKNGATYLRTPAPTRGRGHLHVRIYNILDNDLSGHLRRHLCRNHGSYRERFSICSPYRR